MTPQSVKDALADAETLLAYCRRPLVVAPELRAIGLAMGHTKVSIRRGHSNVAYRRAVAAARLAFRAVPALREE